MCVSDCCKDGCCKDKPRCLRIALLVFLIIDLIDTIIFTIVFIAIAVAAPKKVQVKNPWNNDTYTRDMSLPAWVIGIAAFAVILMILRQVVGWIYYKKGMRLMLIIFVVLTVILLVFAIVTVGALGISGLGIVVNICLLIFGAMLLCEERRKSNEQATVGASAPTGPSTDKGTVAKDDVVVEQPVNAVPADANV